VPRKRVAISPTALLAIWGDMPGKLLLDSSKAFRREGIDRDAGVELQQARDGGSGRVILGGNIPLDMIQKGDNQRADGDGADGQTCLLWRGTIESPFGYTPGVVLGGFGGAKFTEINSFPVDSNEGCASVIPHFRRGGL